MKKIMWAVSFISLVGTAIVLQFMPDSVPMHYDAAGNIDRWGSKYENLIFPIIILIMSLFWTLFIRYFEKKTQTVPNGKESASAKSNAKVLDIVGLCMAVMFTVMQGIILYGAYKAAVSGATQWTVDIGKIVVIMLGIMLIVLGNFMTKTRINGAVGFRVRWSMYNDNTWRRSNRFGAYAIIIAGVITIILAVIFNSFLGAVIAAAGAVTLATVLTLVYAHKVYVQEIESEKRGKI